MLFIDFQNFENFRQKLANFWPKKRHFFADSAKISKNFEKNNFDGKCIKSMGNAPIGLKLGKNVP